VGGRVEEESDSSETQGFTGGGGKKSKNGTGKSGH